MPLSRAAGQGCFLSLLLGLKLETYLMLSRSRLGVVARDVSNLGMGALLRDIGMLHVPPEARWKWRLCSDEVDPAWRDHVTIGYDAVRGTIEPSAAAAVLHHHQHFDGSGFPMRTTISGDDEPLRGTDIHIFARIIAAADTFERMRFPPAQSGAEGQPAPVPVVRVLHQLVRGPESAWLDPLVIKGLVSVAPPFPPGSIVTLSNGLRCAVTSWNPRDPCRPEVAVLDRVALDPARFEEPRERIDLGEAEHLYVVEAEGQHVAGDLFWPQTPDEFDLGKAQSSLLRRPEAAAG
jgi:HD-GYP domain-containing protein (c-di-GMP phosphodiesterase class II)